MNGWKMFRQKSAKQTNAQTQARQANDRRSKVQALAAQIAQSSLSSNGNNAKDNVN